MKLTLIVDSERQAAFHLDSRAVTDDDFRTLASVMVNSVTREALEAGTVHVHSQDMADGIDAYLSPLNAKVGQIRVDPFVHPYSVRITWR